MVRRTLREAIIMTGHTSRQLDAVLAIIATRRGANALQSAIADLHRVNARPVQPCAALYPPCACCAAPVGQCDCDPELATRAAFVRDGLEWN